MTTAPATPQPRDAPVALPPHTSMLDLHAVRRHFVSKGFRVGMVADKWGRVHTLWVDLHGKTAGMGFRVANGGIDPKHLREVVRRYARGEPLIHPHTGRIERVA